MRFSIAKVWGPVRLALILVPALTGCKHEPDFSGLDQVCFQRDVLPIFQNSCAVSGCHNPSTREAGFDFSTYEGIMEGIVPGNADKSEAYKVLGQVYGEMMPPDGPLPKSARTLIRVWIEQGALNSSCTDTTTGNPIVSSYNGLTSHNEGQVCMSCHGPGGDALSKFVIAGTIYDSTKATPYPNATVQLYSSPGSAGTLVLTLEADGKGNFFTTNPVAFGSGLYPTVVASTGNKQSMPASITTGNCYSCHGQGQTPVIWINNGGSVINPSDSICFVRDVQPIFLSNCAKSGCHDAASAQKGYVFTDYTNSIAKGIVPFDPASSKVYQAIISTEAKTLHGIATDKMPPDPSPSLPQDQIQTIYQWILEGAVNFDCSQDPCDLTNVTFSGVVWPIIQNNCLGCHSGTAPSAGIRLEDYASIKTVAMSGQLAGAIQGLQGYTQMPLSGPMDNCSINQVVTWVNEGANNNKKSSR